MQRLIAVATAALALAANTHGQITVPGADGSDGVFNPTADVEVDLSLSPTAAWDAENPDPNTPLTGVYDPDKWAVVFRFSEVDIPAGVEVTFRNHPTRAPVVWLVSGDVTIDGVVSLNAHAAIGSYIPAEPGPGGFRGGIAAGTSNDSSAGFGPGGSTHADAGRSGAGASHATLGGDATGTSQPGPIYSNPRVLPLIGGSGAAGGNHAPYGGSGGAGGGAILICATNDIVLHENGSICANGGVGTGNWIPGASGGAIRLVAEGVSGAGALRAHGANGYQSTDGGDGRVRIEANTITLSDLGDPEYVAGLPGATATIWPSATAPRLRVTQLHTEAVPADPQSRLDFPLADVSVATPDAVVLEIQAENVPLDWTVILRVVPRTGEDFSEPATYVSGTEASSIWQASISLPHGFSAIQARAIAPTAP